MAIRPYWKNGVPGDWERIFLVDSNTIWAAPTVLDPLKTIFSAYNYEFSSDSMRFRIRFSELHGNIYGSGGTSTTLRLKLTSDGGVTFPPANIVTLGILPHADNGSEWGAMHDLELACYARTWGPSFDYVYYVHGFGAPDAGLNTTYTTTVNQTTNQPFTGFMLDSATDTIRRGRIEVFKMRGA